MFANGLSMVAGVGGFVLIVSMCLRARVLPSLARLAISGSAFGLFMSSRYVGLDRSIPGLIFTVGVMLVMFTVGLKHLKAVPPAV